MSASAYPRDSTLLKCELQKLASSLDFKKSVDAVQRLIKNEKVPQSDPPSQNGESQDIDRQ